MAVLKRWRFGKGGEQLDPAQLSLFDEILDADIAAIEVELQRLTPTSRALADDEHPVPRRARLPPGLNRVEITHEPESTVCTTAGCGCALKRIGEEVSEKLDYTPSVFTVQRHFRGKWVCNRCHTFTQATLPSQVIDEGIPTAGLLAQVLVAKYVNHLPFYRQESIWPGPVAPYHAPTLGLCGVQLRA